MRKLLVLLFTLVAPATGLALTEEVGFVTTGDGVQIAVHRFARDTGPNKLPVLLVHGTWGSAGTWNFAGRSCAQYLTDRGYDVYALDLRGMGLSQYAGSFLEIGLSQRTLDVVAAALHVAGRTGQRPVVIGWSQGAVLAALAADATQGQPGPQDDLIAGVGLFGMPGTEPFYAPDEQKAALGALLAAGYDRYLPDATLLFGATFAFDPVTGAPTMDAATYGAFYAGSGPESLLVLGQLADARTWALVTPALRRIEVPALVAAGAQDFFVPVRQTQETYAQLGSLDKDVTILGRNGHGFFLEDNFHATMRVFDAFLARF